MPFVKLDCGMLDSSLWIDRLARELFITALMMAEPFYTTEPIIERETQGFELTEFVIPPGWYGRVRAASTGIIHRAGLSNGDVEQGMDALRRLAQPDPESRSSEFEGRRMVRVPHGFLILNYDKYRQRDLTNAQRQAAHRARMKDKQQKPLTIKRPKRGQSNAVT